MIMSYLYILLWLAVNYASSTPSNTSILRLPSDNHPSFPPTLNTTSNPDTWPQLPITKRVLPHMTLSIHHIQHIETVEARSKMAMSLHYLKRDLPLGGHPHQQVYFNGKAYHDITITLTPLDDRPKIERFEFGVIVNWVYVQMRGYGFVGFSGTIAMNGVEIAEISIFYKGREDRRSASLLGD